MKLLTQEEAREKECPMYPDVDRNCSVFHCMMWTEVHPRIEREDHSGARDMINTRMTSRGHVQKVKRTGPDGSEGVLSIEALGHCSFVLGGIHAPKQ